MMNEFRTMFDLLVNRICYEMLTGWRNVFFGYVREARKGVWKIWISILTSEPLRNYCMVWTLFDIRMFQIVLVR